MEFDNDRRIKPVQKVEIFCWVMLGLIAPLINCITVFIGDLRVRPVPGVFIFDFGLLFLINLILVPAYLLFSRIFVSRFLFKQRYTFFTVISIAWLMVIHAFLFAVYSLILKFNLTSTQQFYFTYHTITVVRETLWIIINMCLATAIGFIKETTDKEDEIAFLQKDNTFYKLRYLRAQLNPHFLFNTLNSIYSLSLQKSERTPEMVIKLADIMRYLIDECNEERIPLTKELEFIRNYIEMEKIRFSADVRFTIEGKTEGRLIEPFLFISFIENGFKHALHYTTEKPFIYVNIKVEPSQVVLNVINNTNINLENQAKKINGKGISNSRSILELLYPDAYELDIIQTEKEERKESKVRLKNAKERLETLYPDTHTLDVILNNNVFTVSLIIKTPAA